MKPMLFEKSANKAIYDNVREAWWNGLSTNAKKNIVRRAEKKQARENFKGVDRTLAYTCPKCFTSYPTAQERNLCKTKHLTAAPDAGGGGGNG